MIAASVAKRLPPERFTAMVRLDQNRAATQLAKKAGVLLKDVSDVFIFGNHSPTMFSAFHLAKINGKPLTEKIGHADWLRKDLQETVGKRGAAVIAARGASSAASAANALVDHVHDLVTPGKIHSIAVKSNGEYGFDPEVWAGMPVKTTSPGSYEVIRKFGGRLWRASMAQSPFNVVAWHGNLAPVKYDTANFMTIGSISFDHPDPSIFTVLTSPSDTPGTANCDFVIFPPRWLVAEDTFRPPWYHRNVMSEFMGLVYGQYDAKPEGFRPGGASLHNCMVPHGPDEEAFEKASSAPLAPHKLDNTLAFMFETRYRFVPTEYAMNGGALDADYAQCWQGLKDEFPKDIR